MDFWGFYMRDNLKVVQNYEVEYNTTKTDTCISIQQL